jgi:hypothetical protein
MPGSDGSRQRTRLRHAVRGPASGEFHPVIVKLVSCRTPSQQQSRPRLAGGPHETACRGCEFFAGCDKQSESNGWCAGAGDCPSSRPSRLLTILSAGTPLFRSARWSHPTVAGWGKLAASQRRTVTGTGQPGVLLHFSVLREDFCLPAVPLSPGLSWPSSIRISDSACGKAHDCNTRC